MLMFQAAQGSTPSVVTPVFTVNINRSLAYHLNRLAGTTGQTATRAANVWAGTTGLALAGALAAKASKPGAGVARSLNSIAGTSGLTAEDAAARIP